MTRTRTRQERWFSSSVLFWLAPVATLALPTIALAVERVLYEAVSAYNTVIVTENEDGLRTLLFEKGGALQSVVKVGDPDYIALPYARVMPVGFALTGQPRRILVIGLGGGTIPSFLHKHYPQATIDVVDIDPEVVSVAKKFFGFREDALMRAVVDDGRRFVENCREPYDVIFLDAFGSDSIPYHLATREFLQAVRRALTPNGVVVGNVWSRLSNRLYDSMVRTYQDVFDDLYIFDVRARENKILVALPRHERIDRDEFARRAGRISKEKQYPFDMGESVRYGYHYVDEKDPSGHVLTDKAEAKKAG